MKISNKMLLLASVISVLIDNSAAALAENGYDSVGDQNKFLANGTPVMTLTGSTKQADFMGGASFAGPVTFSSSPTVFSPNVGIGTSNPLLPLHIESRGTADMLLQSDDDESAGVHYYNSEGAGWWVGKSSTKWTSLTGDSVNGFMFNYDSKYWKSARTVLFLQENGNVGIGTKTPHATLDVNGDVNATGLQLNGKPAIVSCTFEYKSIDMDQVDSATFANRKDRSNYGTQNFSVCQNNVPDKSWQVIGYDVCYDDDSGCTSDGLLCMYAKPNCIVSSQ